MLKSFGPGFIITSAFIGPGTVVSLSLAGAHFGYQLLFVLVFSVITACILQEMAARIGVVTRKGVMQALFNVIPKKHLQIAIATIILAVIGLGCAAYEVGNVAGTSIALTLIFPLSFEVSALICGTIAAIFLLKGEYKLIRLVLMFLVFVMGMVYLVVAILVKPNLSELLQGLFIPTFPKGSLSMALAVIGTTIVPYNLFLHAQAAIKQWPEEMRVEKRVFFARLDCFVAIFIGGVISAAILISAVPFYLMNIDPTDAKFLAQEFQRLLGKGGVYLFAAGLFSAGLTSCITAPLALAFAVCSTFQQEVRLDSYCFRFLALLILLFGVACAFLGVQPLQMILLAQIANGALLPVIAALLIFLSNQDKLLGFFRNSIIINVLGFFSVVVVVFLILIKLTLN